MKHSRPRLLGTLVGHPSRKPGMRIKYGYFFEALRNTFSSVEIFDAALSGRERIRNALSVMSPDFRLWRERFYKNITSFRVRSDRIARYVGSGKCNADMILQLGVLFDSLRSQRQLASMIYTDYTAAMSARRKEAGRSPFNEEEGIEWRRMEHLAYRRASHIFVRASQVLESLVDDYSIHPSKISVVGGGMNLPALPELILRADKKAPVILFIGKDLYRKGGDLLLEAFALTRSQFPEARLKFLTGDAIPRGLSLEGVELIEPTWDRNTIVELYRSADICVLPSRLETWGDVLIEAMAYSLPCIGVAGEAMEDIIQHGSTGLIIPANDVLALQNALVLLMGNRKLRMQFGSAGRRRVEEHFLWDSVVRTMAPVILGAYETQQPRTSSTSFHHP